MNLCENIYILTPTTWYLRPIITQCYFLNKIYYFFNKKIWNIFPIANSISFFLGRGVRITKFFISQMWKINHGFTKEIVNFVMYQSGNYLGKKPYQNMEMKKINIFLHFEIQFILKIKVIWGKKSKFRKFGRLFPWKILCISQNHIYQIIISLIQKLMHIMFLIEVLSCYLMMGFTKV